MEDKKQTKDVVLKIDVESTVNQKEDFVRRMRAYQFISVREKTGMNRKEFSEWLGIPYRTMQEWELERRTMPDYLLNLIEYKVDHEIKKKN